MKKQMFTSKYYKFFPLGVCGAFSLRPAPSRYQRRLKKADRRRIRSGYHMPAQPYPRDTRRHPICKAVEDSREYCATRGVSAMDFGGEDLRMT